MSQEIENLPACLHVSIALPRNVLALAAAANRSHERANTSAADAVEHAVAAGETLAKARELCNAGEWSQFVAEHFDGSLRTAQKYMRLARHWRQISSTTPRGAITSQAEAARAIAQIVRGEGPPAARRRRRRRSSSPNRGEANHGTHLPASGVNGSELVRRAVEVLRSAEHRLATTEPSTDSQQVVLQMLRAGIRDLLVGAHAMSTDGSAHATAATCGHGAAAPEQHDTASDHCGVPHSAGHGE